MQRFGMSMQMPRAKELTIPNWLPGKSIVFFFISMFACFGAFGYVPEFGLWLVAALSVVLFFYGGQAMSKSWERKKEMVFLRNIYIAGLIARFMWVLYCYFFFNPDHFNNVYGDSFMNGGKFLGHSIGLVMDEAPAIAKGFEQQLEPGMTFAVEPKIALPGLGMVGTENTYVITDLGAKSITGRSHSLRVVDPN